jgi:hypothetical protein
VSLPSLTPSWLDRLYAQQPKPLVEHLCDAAAEHFGQALAVWPPEIDLTMPGIQINAQRPDSRAFSCAFEVARFDLLRDTSALDDYFRNRRYLEHGLLEQARGDILFVSRLLLEQLFSLQESTEGRLTRKHLLKILDLTRHHLSRSIELP